MRQCVYICVCRYAYEYMWQQICIQNIYKDYLYIKFICKIYLKIKVVKYNKNGQRLTHSSKEDI